MAEYDSVTIEGTHMPAAGVLARGEQATVAFTERIDRLINGGFVKVIAVHGTPIPDEEAQPADAPEVAPEVAPEGDTDLHVVPARNAKAEVWGAFLESQGIEFDDDDGRDDLIAIWDEHRSDGQ